MNPVSPLLPAAPRRRSGEPRSVSFVVRLRPSERDHLAALAAAHGVHLADLVRRRLLGWELPRPERSLEDAQKYGVLSILSVSLRNTVGNLNGLARAYHSGLPVEGEELLQKVMEVRAQVEAVRRAIAGGE